MVGKRWADLPATQAVLAAVALCHFAHPVLARRWWGSKKPLSKSQGGASCPCWGHSPVFSPTPVSATVSAEPQEEPVCAAAAARLLPLALQPVPCPKGWARWCPLAVVSPVAKALWERGKLLGTGITPALRAPWPNHSHTTRIPSLRRRDGGGSPWLHRENAARDRSPRRTLAPQPQRCRLFVLGAASKQF